MTVRRAIFALLLMGLTGLSAVSPANGAGVLKVGVQLEPPNLDPTSGAAAAIDEVVYANVFEGLTGMVEDGAVEPLLATRWTVSSDAKRYRFFLRTGVRFHDGAPLTARDVKFSLERAGAKGSTNAQRVIFEKIDSIEIIDDHIVEITLSEPLADFPTYLSWGDAVIVSESTAASNAINPIGTGPFQFYAWRRGAAIQLKRNDAYWGPPSALDGVQFLVIPDPTAAFASVMAGDVDGFPNYPAPENLAVLERDDRLIVRTGASEGEVILAMNNGAAPLNDIRVRRAFSHAIDKETLIDGAFFGRGTPIGSHFPPHNPAYLDLSDRYPFDPDRAKALLEASRFDATRPLRLAVPPPAYARRASEVIAAQLRDVGVRVEISNLEWAQWLERVFLGKDFELTIVAHTEPADIDIYARKDYYFQYQNPDFNALINRLRRETDESERRALLQTAQRMIADDAVNVFLASAPKTSVWRSDVTGVWTNAPIQANDFTDADVLGRPAASLALASSPVFPILPVLGGAALILAGVIGWASKARPAYLFKRFAIFAGTLAAAAVVIFVLLDVAPGDPAAFMMGVNADPASIEAVRREFGLDRPAMERFFTWTLGLLQGDFGVSYTYRAPVADLIAERLWISLPLAGLAFFIAAAIGLPTGIYAAARRDSWIGGAIRATAQAGVAIPNFWLAILLVSVFAITLGWISAGGFPGWQAGAGPALKSLIAPAAALAIPQAAILTQVTRASMIETIDTDYMRTARAKGLAFDAALRRHGVRNGLMPVLTILGMQFSFLVAGGVIIENVFYLPGLGRLVVQAIAQRDLVVVKGVVMVLIAVVVFVSFIVDLAYAIADPRLQRQVRA
ncbi:MAG: ABC transporter substrate-binding protein [Pseudomonadota bacterium]